MKVIAFPANWTMLRNLAIDAKEVALPAVGVVITQGASARNFKVGDKVLLPDGDNWVEQRCVGPDESLLLQENKNPIELAEILGAPRIAASILLQSRQLCIDDWIIQTEPLTSVGRYVQKLAHKMRLRTISLVESEDQKVDILERYGDVAISLQNTSSLEEIKKRIDRLGPKLAVLGTVGRPARELKSILPSNCQIVTPIPSSKAVPWWKRPIYNLSLIPEIVTDEVGLSMIDFLSRHFDCAMMDRDRSNLWSMDDFPTAINNLDSSKQSILFDQNQNK